MKQALIDLLQHLDTCWELGEDCINPDTGLIVSDSEYDDLVSKLKILDPSNIRFTQPSDSKVVHNSKKIKHNPPMTSISKASHEDLKIQTSQLIKWLNESSNNPKDVIVSGVSYPSKTFYQQYKIDGVALRLYYENGLLSKAGLRPRDGINGEDVTEQVKYIPSIPQKLKLPISCIVSGEVYCKKSDFALVQDDCRKNGEKLRANPRNHAAGGIRQFKDPTIVSRMRLSFLAHGIEGDDVDKETEIEKAIWANKELGIQFVRTHFFNFEDLQKLEDNAPNLDYMVDGIVLGVNNVEDQEQLGRHGNSNTGNPKGKIAWKFRAESAVVTISRIDYQTGRTGRVVPVALFPDVHLAGTNVGRATLHNFGFVDEKQIHVGCDIRIVKAGEIIPKVIAAYPKGGKPSFPVYCPSCGSPLVKENSKTEAHKFDLYCKSLTCSAQIAGRLLHFLDTIEVMGIGESIVNILVDKGLVREFADFYTLTLPALLRVGFSERQSLLILAAMEMIPNPEKIKDNAALYALIQNKSKKKIPLAKFIAALGIRGAAKNTGKNLVNHFGNFEDIRNASVDTLLSVQDIGDTTANELFSAFRDLKSEIDNVLVHVELELPKQGKLSGMTFCLSGKLDKRTLTSKIEELGGKVSGSVSKKINYLVAGDGSGAKSDSATQLNIPILTIDQLEKML